DVPNVVFSCGQVMRDDTLYVYYGGADTAIGVATADKEQVLVFLKG
ncbi:MAG: glycosidase, partial [Anaerolineae bacterium]|nr:glycosidase [Anaerolineae bacterium]